MSGPATNESFVYDGQGDRLRAYDQSSANYQLHTLVQDLRPGGMSGLLSDGAADYAYADFGVGAAPVARMDAGSSQGAYLATDLLGSGAPGHQPLRPDPRRGQPTTPGAPPGRSPPTPPGRCCSPGCRPAAPFGYAGQPTTPGRARTACGPGSTTRAQGRFQSVDPLLARTGQPYAYANDQPTLLTDPGGQAADAGTDGYHSAYWEVADSSSLQGQLKRAVARAFVATDNTGGSFWDARLTQSSADLSGSDVPHADLISFAPLHGVNGRAVAEVYNIALDEYANAGGDLNQPGNFLADVSSIYPNELLALQGLGARARAGAEVFYQGLAGTKDACRRMQPTLVLGGRYPVPFGVALTAPSGPQVGPAVGNTGPYAGGGVRDGRLLDHYLNVPAGGKVYHVFPRLLAAGVIGYSACAPGAPGTFLRFFQTQDSCENPGPYGHANACAFTGWAQGPLCALDLAIGGWGAPTPAAGTATGAAASGWSRRW